MNLTPTDTGRNTTEKLFGVGNHVEATANGKIVSDAIHDAFELYVGYWMVLFLSVLGLVTNSLTMIVFLRQGFRDSGERVSFVYRLLGPNQMSLRCNLSHAQNIRLGKSSLGYQLEVDDVAIFDLLADNFGLRLVCVGHACFYRALPKREHTVQSEISDYSCTYHEIHGRDISAGV